jgi:hypothetical protein
VHIKFLRHSTGSGIEAIRYLLDELDAQARPRAGVRVLRGDPFLLGRLIDAIANVHRYTSGAISWHIADSPTEEEVDGVLTDIERIGFAGLQPDQFHLCAVQHTKNDGSQHVHLVGPRCEIRTGKALNFASPGWEYWADPVRDYWNYSRGWARPEDPERARLVRPPLRMPAMLAADPDTPTGRTDPRACIVEAVIAGVLTGTVRSQREVMEVLSRHGEAVRRGPDYVSLCPPGSARAIPLKGLLFRSEFDLDAVMRVMVRAADPPRLGRDPPDAERAAEAYLRMATIEQSRGRFHQSRYPACAPVPRRSKAGASSAADDAEHWDVAVPVAPQPSLAASPVGVAPSSEVPGRPIQTTMGETAYDRDRDAAAQYFQGVLAEARRGLRRLIEAAQRAVRAGEQLARASQRLGGEIGRLDRAIARIKSAAQERVEPCATPAPTSEMSKTRVKS